MTGSKVLMVGWDGATLDVVEPLIAAGRLPTMERLFRDGVVAPLNSTQPPMTLPAWSSFLTGANPGKHGIFDFVHRRVGSYDLEFTNSTFRGVPTIFRWLSDRGARVASVAVPTTWPPEQLNGVQISGFDSPIATGIDGTFVTPKGVYEEVVRRFGGMKFADFQELEIGEGWHARALAAMRAEIQRKTAITEWLLGQERWDAFMLLFGETDTVSHHFWRFHDVKSPRHPKNCSSELRDALSDIYVRCDAALGRLIDAAKPDLVCIASDHGFGGAGDRGLHLNRFLAEKGWLRFHGTGRRDRWRRRILPKVPLEIQQQVFRRLPSKWLGQLEGRTRYGSIEFSSTKAWSDEMNYAATIHLNVEGRDPLGTVRDVDATLRGLTKDLLEWRVDGEPVVQAVHRREDLYQGPFVERSPDLVLERTEPEGYTWTLLSSALGTSPSRRLTTDELAGAKGLGMNGTHRQHGIWVLSGKGIAANRRISADIVDPTPTMLAWMGVPIPDFVDGRVRQSAFSEPIAPVFSKQFSESASKRAASTEEAGAMRRRLESLGYL